MSRYCPCCGQVTAAQKLLIEEAEFCGEQCIYFLEGASNPNLKQYKIPWYIEQAASYASSAWRNALLVED